MEWPTRVAWGERRGGVAGEDILRNWMRRVVVGQDRVKVGEGGSEARMGDGGGFEHAELRSLFVQGAVGELGVG